MGYDQRLGGFTEQQYFFLLFSNFAETHVRESIHVVVDTGLSTPRFTIYCHCDGLIEIQEQATQGPIIYLCKKT